MHLAMSQRLASLLTSSTLVAGWKFGHWASNRDFSVWSRVSSGVGRKTPNPKRSRPFQMSCRLLSSTSVYKFFRRLCCPKFRLDWAFAHPKRLLLALRSSFQNTQGSWVQRRASLRRILLGEQRWVVFRRFTTGWNHGRWLWRLQPRWIRPRDLPKSDKTKHLKRKHFERLVSFGKLAMIQKTTVVNPIWYAWLITMASFFVDFFLLSCFLYSLRNNLWFQSAAWRPFTF